MDGSKLVTMMENEDWEAALAYCNQAITADPKSSSAWLNRGVILYKIVRQNCRQFKNNSFAWIIVLFDKSGTMHRSAHDRIRGLIGRSYASQLAPLLDEAARSFEEAVKLDQEYSNAHISLGILHRDTGCFKQAEANLTRAIELAEEGSKETAQHLLNSMKNFDWAEVARFAISEQIVYYPVENHYGEKVSRIVKAITANMI